MHNIPHTEATKIKISKANKGKPSNFLGKNHTKESKRKMSLKLKGRTVWNKGLKSTQVFSTRTGKYKKCETCGKEFYAPGWLIKKGFGKFCSLNCRRHSEEARKKMSKSRKGKCIGVNNCNWKDGITPINDLIRKSKEHKEWAMSVYKRNNFICQDCGIKCSAKNIVAHHIKSFSDYPKLRFDIDNGITLCRSCHVKLHHQLNFGMASLAFATP